MGKDDRDRSPSPLLVYLMSELGKILPPEQGGELAAFDIAQTSAHGDFHRAFRCAEWAVEIAPRETQQKHRHLIDRLKEAIQVLRDTEYGISFGAMVGDAPRAKERLHRDPRYKVDSIDALEGIEVAWVDDAITIARSAADASGWSSVPWRDLVKDLISIHTA